MSAKRYRLWINTKGEPLYVELVSGPEPSPETIHQIADTIEQALRASKPIVLARDWEIRVVAA